MRGLFLSGDGRRARFAVALAALKAAGWTQAGVADAMALSGQSMVSRLARGTRQPSERTCRQIEALVREVYP